MKTIVGVDENGLGPILGPMISTAVTLEVPEYERQSLAKLGEIQGIVDSKQSSAFGKMRFAESLALATVEAIEGRVPQTVDDLLGALSLEPLGALRAPCPSSTFDQCWSSSLALPHFGGSVQVGRQAIAALAEHRIVIRRARSVLRCVGVLNANVATGRNKLIVNLHAFEQLILDARRHAEDELVAYCGIIGGLRSYADRFAHFPRSALTHAQEVKGQSVYRFDGLGEVRFEVDADAGHMPVAWASVVGKYVREIAMARLNAYYSKATGEEVDVSGYRDPVTKRFIAASEPHRRRLGIVESCFAREK